MDSTNNHNAAKFTFFYMLSLVALVFMAISSGMIIFQIINKTIVDILKEYQGRFSSEQLKFAISALIISAPIFYITASQIYKNLFSGVLDKDSAVRRWLTYLILFASSVTMIGWLIGTVNSFLDGDLTMKFVLKSITAIGIAAAVFTFYLYDIKRDQVKGKKDLTIRLYFYGSLIIVAAIFISSLFIVESPQATRDRKIDNAVINNFQSIDSAVNQYYRDYEKIPANLDVLKQEFNYIADKDLINPDTKKEYEYKVLGDKKYELCSFFRASNINDDNQDNYYKNNWPHEAGEQCISQRVNNNGVKEPYQ